MQAAAAVSPRLDLLDALRGFAIVSIMLLHNIEHFDLYFVPADLPAWLTAVDRVVWDSMFFLFGGKSYAIFALLFGVTFYLQLHRRAQRGEDFRPRYAWRLVLLLGFGLVNSMFYHGDILSIYAVLGLLLIPVAHMRSALVFAIAVLLLLQPYAWFDYLRAISAPAEKLADPASWKYFGRANEYMQHGSIAEVWFGNLTNGKTGVILWSWENGRLFQIPALFMLGMLAARKNLFHLSPENKRHWLRALTIALLLFIPLYLLKSNPLWWQQEAAHPGLLTILTSWSNLALMVVLVAGFSLAFYSRPVLAFLSPLGRMSLTSYVMQSVVGTCIYYGFGLGLYRYTGASTALLIGIVLALAQRQFSVWWLRSHQQGPLEALWHRAT
ncbi:MAG: DUF418 domain-containing protein, partial [Duganella sp.]